MLLTGIAIFALHSISQNNRIAKNSAVNTLTSKEKKSVSKLLFDGSTTSICNSYGRPVSGPSWKVGEGTIYYDTTDEKKIHDRDLVTDKEFFEFRPEI